jgi:hypothetical protein
VELKDYCEHAELNHTKLKFISNKEYSDYDVSQTSREAIQNTFEFQDEYEGWQHYENEKFAFITIVTHECRSAIDNTLIAPFIRYNDNRMTIMGVTALNR